MAGRLPDHRVRLPVNSQYWQSLTFLHWPVAPSALQPLLPPQLELDTFDGEAWLGITPFWMSYLGTPGPRVPVVPAFAEVNVRTYVRAPDGHDGVWFFSLECSRARVVAMLRLLGLPYVRGQTWAASRGSRTWFGSTRGSGRGICMGESRAGSPLSDPDPLVNFLTGRWNAFTMVAGRLLRVPIEHEPWPLHTARAAVDVAGLLAANALPPVDGPPLAHYAPLVHVDIGAPRLVTLR